MTYAHNPSSHIPPSLGFLFEHLIQGKLNKIWEKKVSKNMNLDVLER